MSSLKCTCHFELHSPEAVKERVKTQSNFLHEKGGTIWNIKFYNNGCSAYTKARELCQTKGLHLEY
jgi:hypothetical protein